MLRANFCGSSASSSSDLAFDCPIKSSAGPLSTASTSSLSVSPHKTQQQQQQQQPQSQQATTSRPSLLQQLHHHHHHRSDRTTQQPHKLALPHTITERHGGQDLWVTAPVLADVLEKEGFRWRKKWKSRFVELNGRVLSYYELTGKPPACTRSASLLPHATEPVACTPTSASSQSERTLLTSPVRHAPKPRKSVHLSADAVLIDINALTFSLAPATGEKPWVFRAPDGATKLKWCRALHDCIDILMWLRHYTLSDVLGVGGNGVVRQLVDDRDGQKYAVKIVDASKFKNRAAAVAEVEIMRNITNDIRHPNLVKIHKVYEEAEKIYMIMDLCEGGELYDAIVHRGCYGEADAARIMHPLMSALQALHKHNILHLDIKPENILLSSKDSLTAKVILTDFGLARIVNGKENPLDAGKTTMAGTIGYIAPEVIAAHQYSEAADVFSAGVILFILLVGYPPFFGDSEVEILLKIARGDFQFHKDDWAHISMPAKELVARMLEVRAQDRITVDEVLHHPWIVENCSTDSTANTNGPTLNKTMERMQQFNFLRKSENMANCMTGMLAEESEEDYHALINVQAIDSMIRQLTPSGSSKVMIEKASTLAKGLGISPYLDIKSYVEFLDRNQDGFIDAQDFCDGVVAMRDGHESFATIVFAALLKMDHVVTTDVASLSAPTLTRAHFQGAFEKLNCPDALQAVFFKYLDEHPEETGADRDAIGEAEFIGLMKKFRFLGMLFMLKARNNVVMMAHMASADKLPLISEEIRESLLGSPDEPVSVS